MPSGSFLIGSDAKGSGHEGPFASLLPYPFFLRCATTIRMIARTMIHPNRISSADSITSSSVGPTFMRCLLAIRSGHASAAR